MKRLLGLIPVLLCASSASAQLTTTKYGLGHPDDFVYRREIFLVPPPQGPPDRLFAGVLKGSYQYSRGRYDAVGTPSDCGAGSTAFTQIDRNCSPSPVLTEAIA
jgi:hypothetical protein